MVILIAGFLLGRALPTTPPQPDANQQSGGLVETVRKENSLTVPQLPLAPAPDQVIVNVNGRPIRAFEIEPFLWDWRGFEVANDLVTYRLIQQEAAKFNISISPNDLNFALKVELKSIQDRLGPAANLDKALRAQGFPRSRIYMKVHSDLLLERIALKHFDPHKFLKVAALVFAPKSAMASDVSAAIGRAQDAYNRLTKGGDWQAEIPATDDPDAIKTKGGSIGWRSLDAFPMGTQQQLKGQHLGGYTTPVEVGGAIQIFRLDARGDSTSGSDLDQLRRDFQTSERRKLIEQLQSSAKIDRIFIGSPRPIK